MKRIRLLITTMAAAACAMPARTVPGGDARTDSSSYVVEDLYSDSLEQARFMAFLQEWDPAVRPLQATGNFLGQLHLIDSLGAGYPRSQSVRSLVGQQRATLLSFLGRPMEAHTAFDAVSEPEPGTLAISLDGYTFEPALEAVLAVADTAQVVFINEAHHVPQHRILPTALLEGLWDQGFRYFAAETFAAIDSALDERGYPVRTSGYYTSEPVFGHLVRTAAELGYTLVPYEASGARSQEARERGQAANLVSRILDRDADAKILVHAGYGHINESGVFAGSGAAPMAVHFRELAGIDPVTIDQTVMTEASEPAYETGPYRRLTTERDLTEPAVLRGEPGGKLWSARTGVHDVTVVHPRTRLRDGRPHWLWDSGRRRPFRLDPGLCGEADRCVVEARSTAESDDAVPVDRILVDDPANPPPLLLPPGDYTVRVLTAAGMVVSSVEIAH